MSPSGFFLFLYRKSFFLVHPPLIRIPLSNAFIAPDRKYNDTVPEVSGLHFNVVGCPTLSAKPGGIEKAFGLSAWARASASSDAATGIKEKRMI